MGVFSPCPQGAVLLHRIRQIVVSSGGSYVIHDLYWAAPVSGVACAELPMGVFSPCP